MIGYWAHSLGRAPSSGLHYEVCGRPMCKYRPAASMVFQVCAAASRTDLLTCRDCKKRAELLNPKRPTTPRDHPQGGHGEARPGRGEPTDAAR